MAEGESEKEKVSQIDAKEGAQILAQSKSKNDGLSNLKKKLQSFFVCGVKSKFQSFDFSNTANEKSPILLKSQQGLDPFIMALKHFVQTKELPKERYRNVIKRWGPHCLIQDGLTMIKHSRPAGGCTSRPDIRYNRRGPRVTFGRA